jgi:hypothetical protein
VRIQGLARLLVFAAALLLPLRIVAQGYLPEDDALRHAGKVVSGRSWSEILVLREGVAIDLHPGWHAVLGAVHSLTDASAPELVLFAVIALFVLFCAPGLALFERPEAYLLALLAIGLTDPPRFNRLFLGRPFLVTAAGLNLVLLLWPRLQAPSRTPWRLLAVMTAVVGLAVWIHPSFYLWGVPILGGLCAREWRASARLALCVAAGSLVGGALSGHPVGLLLQNFRHGLTTVDVGAAPVTMVQELGPYMPPPSILFLFFLLLLRRVLAGRTVGSALDTPVVWLAGLGWVLGFLSGRFWFDFGLPAFVLFVAGELQDALASGMGAEQPRRRAVVAAAAVVFVLALSANIGGRFSHTEGRRYATLFGPAGQAALPEPGGVLYSDSMDLFFQGFYRAPRAPWRYLVGFEASIMPPDDRALYRRMLEAHPAHPPELFEPWVSRMTPADRLILETNGPADPPPIPRLAWTFVPPTFWSGRVAPEGAPPAR